MRPETIRATRSLCLAGLALAVAGCSGGHGHGHGGGHSGPPVLDEIEPNDSPYQPDFLGGVDSVSHFVVAGHVEAVGHDVYDHFELVAEEPVGIEFYLHGLAHHADLDLCLWDPDLEEIVACYDGPWNPEEGYFTLDWPGKRVVLLVEAWIVDSAYDLEILATPHPYEDGGDGGNGPAAGSGAGISFPYGRPEPSPDKRGPEALDEELLVLALRNPDGRGGL